MDGDCDSKENSRPEAERAPEGPDPEALGNQPTVAPVICAAYLFKGHIINALYAILVVVLAFVTLSQFRTVDTCGVFKESLCWALILDFTAVQPLTVAFTGLYRWLASDDQERSPNAELHPFDGAIRPL